ncbi:formate dehydrogenase subunit gamma [Paracraurococcus lichenis]|uniref:Formate dehydrogenase subunit gamma n=1 Tax=Paracraurococcus lichenis TaxID=3064888 RepID=A0ABT9E887_9PROT|nr:formate dehydrogenase subunit gamma [Paracraurococcus sp. LOR1-02]MDO9712417.1 formate dehydrogenase subunit gamma [Paracraurococcus sp. LOR1-02]
MTARRLAAFGLVLLLAGGALAQPQQAPGVSAASPDVQSAAPEVGAGRGGPNAQPPEPAQRPSATGQPRSASPEGIAPRPPVPVQPQVAPPPFTARGGPVAAEVELEEARRLGMVRGLVSIPNQAAGVLIQPKGRDWRGWRTTVLTIAGGLIVLGTIGLLAALYLWKGPTPIEAGRAGLRIHRYNLLERFNHWMVATSFVVLGLSGLNITFGVYVLRPIIGAEAFTALTWWGQAAHQFLSFPFILGILVMAALWARDNWPTRVDVAWVKAGGPAAKGHPPAGRFNAAQKALFWFQVGGGVLAAITGYLLMAPAILDNITDQQVAHFVHAALAMVMIAVILGHIYIGTIGTEGAFEAMQTGEVDVNYAREHHSVWLEERVEQARRTVAPPGARAAGAD